MSLMQDDRNTQAPYMVHGVCLDCGKVFTTRPMPGIVPMCGHCGSIDIEATRVVREGR